MSQKSYAKTFRELVQAPLIFFTGVHLAGPRLTAKTFQSGLDRFPADEVGLLYDDLEAQHPARFIVGRSMA